MSQPVYSDILYEERDHVATITFNRPEKLNAFRGHTYSEVLDAVHRGGWNPDIGAIVMAAFGPTRARCVPPWASLPKSSSKRLAPLATSIWIPESAASSSATTRRRASRIHDTTGPGPGR